MLRHYLNLPRTVHVLCVGTFINRAGTLLLPFLTLYLTTERGLSVKFANLAMGALGAGSIIGALVGGQLADRIGRRPVMLISLLGTAVVLRCFGSLTSPIAIVAAVALFSVLADMYRPAASAMVADVVGPEQRPRAFGLVYVSVNLGFSVGAVLGGFLTTLWFQWLFWVDGLTAAAYAAIILFLIRETLPSRRLRYPTDDTPTPPVEDTGPDDAGLLQAARHIATDVPFVVFCAASLLVGLAFVQALSTFPIHLGHQGVGAEAYGRIIALNGILIVICQLPLTALLNRFNRASVIVWAAVVHAVGFGLIGLAGSAGEFALTVVVWTVGEMMSAAFLFAIVTDLAPTRFRARYLGAFSMTHSSAMMLGAPLGGMVLDHLGGSVLWSATCVLGLVAALLYLSVHRRLTHNAPDTSA